MKRIQEEKLRGYLKHRFESSIRQDSIEELAHLLFTESLFISGYEQEGRFAVSIYGKPVLLQLTAFRTLAKLAMAILANDEGGWVQSDQIDKDNTARYMHRLRTEIDEQLQMPGLGVLIIINNKNSEYRLSFTPQHIILDPELEHFTEDRNLKNEIEAYL